MINFIQQTYIDFLLTFMYLFIAFSFVIPLRMYAKRLAKRGGRWIAIAKVIFYPFGILFLIGDVAWNVIYAPLVFFQRANKFNEGWTLTGRMKYHKRQKGIYWQKKVSLFLCNNFAEKVDRGHCG